MAKENINSMMPDIFDMKILLHKLRENLHELEQESNLCFCFYLHPVLGLCGFLGLSKIRMNQIRSTYVISNQKRMSEGIYSSL